jgi:flagellar FliL protein
MNETKKASASEPRARKKFPRVILASVVVFAIVAGGGFAWLSQSHDRANNTVHAGKSAAAPKYVVRMEGFTVNLADPEETHFLRVTIELGIDSLPEGADPAKPAQSLPVPRIRDAILSVLTICRADELLTPEGKTRLKQNLLAALNRSVPEMGVREIYFTEFLVQR